jgi:hypothetical protein
MQISGICSGNLQLQMMNNSHVRPSEEEIFNRIDSNGDGSIDKSEMEAMAAKRPMQNAEAPDVEEMFDRFDSDGNGLLNEDEAAAMHEEMLQKTQSMRPAGGPPGGMSQMMNMQSEEEEEEQGLSFILNSAMESYSAQESYSDSYIAAALLQSEWLV